MQTGDWDDSAWAPPSAHDSADAALLPGYRDFVQIARGGDSIVYQAHQDALDRDVAIKVVELDDDESIARFRRELAITVQLGRQHPNIMTVLATGTTSHGQPCLVMDHVELGSLHDRLATHGPLPVSEVVAAGTVIADALAFAHGQGVLHRDVKPQNVLVLPTSWVLADFGLARAIDAGHSSSLERFSYRHASPQVLDGEAPTIADDVYSLGSTLHTLLDGRAPFAATDPDEDSALSYLRRARTEEPRRLLRDDIPPALRAIVTRCLARQRADRFPDAAALRDALEAVPTESRNWAPAPAPVDDEPDPLTAFAPPPDPASPATPTSAPTSDDLQTVAVDEQRQPSVDHEERVPVAADEPARSALAQLGRTPTAAADADATGLRPVDDPPDGAHDGGDGSFHGPASGGRARWIAVGAIAVVALGAGIGIGFWRSSGDGSPSAGPPGTVTSPRPTPTPTPSVDRIPSTSANTPTAAASYALVQGTDPRITSYARNSATSIELQWHDTSKGRYSFIVFEVTGVRTPEFPVDAGHTSATVPAVLAGRHCFQIGVVVPDGKGGHRLRVGPEACKTT